VGIEGSDMSHSEASISHLAHHFSDSSQQRDAAKFGMWIFILSELMLFGGLFVAYTVFRVIYPDMFYNAHKELSLTLGTINTAILITSSVTIALAIHYIQLGKKRHTIYLLFCTLALATGFLVIKFFEYHHKFELGQLPGKFYNYTGVAGTNPHIFFSIYFLMTGLHALHIIGGMIVISIMLKRTIKGVFSNSYYTPLELTGLYWHLVDLIWIFLFPLLYLIG
jgi:cytochrome c oxidase subunit 3